MATVKVVEKDHLECELLQIVQEAYDSASKDGTFYVGLSGGSLPPLLIRVLRQMKNVDWKKWLFFFCDERCVPSSSEESTFGVYKRLLDPVDESLPLSLNQFVTIDPALKSAKVAEDYLSKMRLRFDKKASLPRFHILFLGLGPDGHTCSLFPGHKLLKVRRSSYQDTPAQVAFRYFGVNDLTTISTSHYPLDISDDQESLKWICYIADSPKPPPERITMTLPVLNNSKLCVFVATGESKAQVIKEILEDKKPGYPAGMVQPHSGKLIWLMDKEAGSKLKSITSVAS